VCFFAFFGAKIWPAAAGPGELARDLRDQTQDLTRLIIRAFLGDADEGMGRPRAEA